MAALYHDLGVIYLGELGPVIVCGTVAVLLAVTLTVTWVDWRRERRARGFETGRRRG